MNPDDQTGRNGGQGQPISAAEPYRTPTDVSDTPIRRGMFRSPVAWIMTIAAVITIGGMFAFTTVSREMRDFNENRMSVEEYQRSMSAEQVADYERSMSAEE